MAPIARLRPPHSPDTPTGHTHQPRPPATPTSHTHRQTYLLHPPATSISPMTHVCGGCVCQVGVSGVRVRCVWQTYLTHPPATPTCYSYSHFHVSMLLMYVMDGCIRWACQVGVWGGCGTPPTCHTHRTHPPATPTCHTYQPHPSTHLPATSSSHFH